jgi:uncharacterized membrane protein YfcA
MTRRSLLAWRSLKRTLRDPVLPLLILGVIGATFTAIVIFDAPTHVVVGIFGAGCLTAIFETRMHNRKND